MRQRTLKLEVQNPCGESWDKMSEADRGRFCSACSKTVVDFSVMSDQEVLSYFSQNKDSICGRFAQDQLCKTFSKKKTSTALFASFRQLVAATLIVISQGLTPARSYGAPGQTEIIASHSDTAIERGRYIRGRVVDHVTNTPIPGMDVVVNGTDVKTIADSSGCFMLFIPAGYPGRQLELHARYSTVSGPQPRGTIMRPIQVQLDEKALQTELVIYRYPQTEMPATKIIAHKTPVTTITVMGGAMPLWVQEPRKPGVFRRFTNLFRKKSRQ